MNIGQDKTCFSINELRECVAEDVASSNDSLEASVTYLNRYFAHGCDGNKLFFTPAINYGGAESYETFETIDDGSMKKRVFNYVDKVTMMKGAKPSTVSLKQQFFDTCDCTLKIGSDPRETRFYTDPTSKMNFINLSPGFLHKGLCLTAIILPTFRLMSSKCLIISRTCGTAKTKQPMTIA